MVNSEVNYLSVETELHTSVTIESPVRTYGNVTMKKGVKIGKFSFVNSDSYLFSQTEIGRYTSIGKRCEIGAFDHPLEWGSVSPVFYNQKLHFPDYTGYFDQFERDYVKGGVKIGNDVWIGTGVLIRRGITIGDGAVIAAGAVVTKDVPPYAIVGGLPSKLIRYRFSTEVIKKLLMLKWWDLDIVDLKGVDFTDPDKMIESLSQITGIGFGVRDEVDVLEVIKGMMACEGLDDLLIGHLEINKMKLYLKYDLADVYDQQILNNKVEHICQLRNTGCGIEVLKEEVLTIFLTKE